MLFPSVCTQSQGRAWPQLHTGLSPPGRSRLEHARQVISRDSSRRFILQGLFTAAVTSSLPGPAEAEQILSPSLNPELQQFWDQCLDAARRDFNTGIDVNLIVWGKRVELPFAAPGDPASDYTTGGVFGVIKGCGVRLNSSARPYKGCPDPGQVADTELLSECCRHFAYCVPYTPGTKAWINNTTAVVVSDRINLTPPDVARGLLIHELGHVIDFACFGSRYRRTDLPITGPRKDAMMERMAGESDVEIRADLLANMVLESVTKGRNEEKLCYRTDTKIQTLVPETEQCSGLLDGTGGKRTNGASVSGKYVEHYLHDPLDSALLKL